MMWVNTLSENLNSLKIFDLDKPVISALVSAFNVGLEYVNELSESFLNNAFVKTGDLASINRRERLLRSYNTSLNLSDKKSFLLNWGKYSAGFKEDLDGKLLSVGIVGNLVENYGDGVYVNITELKGVEKEVALKQVERILPAHLPIYTDFTGQSWGGLDSQNKSFEEIDSLDRTWDGFDNLE